MDSNTELTIKTLIETQIIQALSNAPEEMIEKLVKAALSKPVETDRYSGKTMPYLDHMVGEEIRGAAQDAARKVVRERMPEIEAHVRAGLSSESVVAAVTNALVGAANEDWRITVNFEAEKPR